jgi:hypothetical protein
MALMSCGNFDASYCSDPASLETMLRKKPNITKTLSLNDDGKKFISFEEWDDLCQNLILVEHDDDDKYEKYIFKPWFKNKTSEMMDKIQSWRDTVLHEWSEGAEGRTDYKVY